MKYQKNHFGELSLGPTELLVVVLLWSSMAYDCMSPLYLSYKHLGASIGCVGIRGTPRRIGSIGGISATIGP